MRHILRRFARENSGATAIEYGLIAGFLAICLVAALPGITGALSTRFTAIGSAFTGQ